MHATDTSETHNKGYHIPFAAGNYVHAGGAVRRDGAAFACTWNEQQPTDRFTVISGAVSAAQICTLYIATLHYTLDVCVAF